MMKKTSIVVFLLLLLVLIRINDGLSFLHHRHPNCVVVNNRKQKQKQWMMILSSSERTTNNNRRILLLPRKRNHHHHDYYHPSIVILRMQDGAGNNQNDDEPAVQDELITSKTTTTTTTTTTNNSSDSNNNNNNNEVGAITGTVNERLLAELEDARKKEIYGARSEFSTLGKKQKKVGLQNIVISTLQSGRQRYKSDEERMAAIEEAKNLNGIQPVTAYAGAITALGIAFGLWYCTNWLLEYFAIHSIDANNTSYFIQRIIQVVRNMIVGLFTLCSGFFGVTGLGILLLAIRVTYGVLIGELDPTPPAPPKNTTNNNLATAIEKENVMNNAWDLMLNKKPGRKGRR